MGHNSKSTVPIQETATGTGSVPLSRASTIVFHKALTSWPCYAWLRIRQGREDLAWIRGETRAGFKRWHPKDKLEGTGNSQCLPQRWLCFCGRTKTGGREASWHTLIWFRNKIKIRGILNSLNPNHTPHLRHVISYSKFKKKPPWGCKTKYFG
jgi:hypothetical protein